MYGQIGLFVEAWWLTVGPNTCNLLSSNPCIPLSRLHLRSNLLQRVYVYPLGLLYTQVWPRWNENILCKIFIFSWILLLFCWRTSVIIQWMMLPMYSFKSTMFWRRWTAIKIYNWRRIQKQSQCSKETMVHVPTHK